MSDSHNSAAHTTASVSVKAVIAALMLASFISSLGQMIFTTSLPTIVGEFGGISQMTWVISGFLLGQTIALPIFGKIGDLVNRKPLFIGANILFLFGSTLGAMATGMTMLITGRAIQGIAGGAMMILSQAITAEVTTVRERGKYMGFMGAAFGVASVLGPILGGWITDHIGWRWGMWLNLPLGLITIFVTLRYMKLESKPPRFTLDFAGTACMATATTAIVLLATWGGRDYAWSDPVIVTLALLAVAATICLVIVEQKVRDPLIPLQLFRNRNFTLATLAGVAVGILMFGTLAYMPTYIQMVHSLPASHAGYMMIPLMAGMVVTSMGIGSIVSRFGRYKIYPIIGQVIIALALLCLGVLSPQASLITVGAVLALFGFGLGLSMQILILIVQNAFPLHLVGTATGTNNFFRQVAGTVGSAVVGSIFLTHLHEQLVARLPQALSQVGDPALSTQLAQGNGLTPAIVATLPPVVQDAIALSYHHALSPVFFMLAPLSALAATMLWFITEDQLRETA